MTSTLECSVAPPNSIIFVADPTFEYEIPSGIGSGLIAATNTCVAVGTLAEMDGETTVWLGSALQNPIGQLVFRGYIETRGFRVAVITSGADTILSIDVPCQKTQISIWTNDFNEPDKIEIQAR